MKNKKLLITLGLIALVIILLYFGVKQQTYEPELNETITYHMIEPTSIFNYRPASINYSYIADLEQAKEPFIKYPILIWIAVIIFLVVILLYILSLKKSKKSHRK